VALDEVQAWSSTDQMAFEKYGRPHPRPMGFPMFDDDGSDIDALPTVVLKVLQPVRHA
jgi:hypothetical protein